MKKTITLLAICIAFSSYIIAQNQSDSLMQKISSGQGNLWNKNNSESTIYNNPLNYNVAVGKDNAQVPLDVEGQISADSLNISGSIEVDSIHARSIRVGENSLWLGGLPSTTPDGWGASDFIQSDNGYINIGRYNGDFDDITVAIGKEINAPDPNQYQNIKLDVEGSVNVKEDDGYCIGGWLSFSEKGTTLSIGQNAGNNLMYYS